MTLGNGNNVNHLVLLENRVDGDGLLEVLLGPVDLVLGGTTVDLDLSQVCLLLGQWGVLDLGVDQNSDDRGVLGDSGQLTVDLVSVLGVLGGVLGESFFLDLYQFL